MQCFFAKKEQAIIRSSAEKAFGKIQFLTEVFFSKKENGAIPPIQGVDSDIAFA